jgi:predicted TIM-barrel fold metal-dependent hydrolase
MTREPPLETKFRDVLDLARLPYFELRAGRLALADPALGPAIDLHTHLALAYGPRSRLDLLRATPETEHYLPSRGAPIDLEVYANRNFTTEALARMKRDLTIMSFTARGMRATHTAPNLEREMADLGIARAVLLPIDFPILSRNAQSYLRVAARGGPLVAFGSVHPYAPGLARRLDAQRAAGARGVKVHPAVQMVPPDDRRAMRLYRLAGERGMPIFFHCGPVGIETRLGRRLSRVRRYERAAAENPRTTFVFGHSGALELAEALALARRYENVWMELSSQPLAGVRRILAETAPERIVFGSDWPFYHQAIGLAKALIATEGAPALRRRVLYENAARLLDL